MVQSDSLKRLTLKMRVLDAALFSDQPAKAVSDLLASSEQILSQDEISTLYKLTE